jgi:DNA-binding beta-propeller fold protein YncE
VFDYRDVWVIDPMSAKVIGTIPIPGVPEFMVYDESTDRIYLNIKSKDVVAVIDPPRPSLPSPIPVNNPVHNHDFETETSHSFSRLR